MLENELATVTYVGDGIATEFNFAFKIPTGFLKVYLFDSTTDTTITLEEGTDYSVTGLDDENGGKVTYLKDPFDNTKRITVQRDPTFKQSLDLKSQSSWNPENLEGQLDKMVMQTQKLKADVARSVTIPIGSPTTPEDYLAELGQLKAAAAQSASAASTSATAAATSETNSATSATQAANSATAAAGSKTAAATSATLASNSAANAATSETNAGDSETAAAQSATTATNKANAAAASATAAGNSATSAAGSATSATNSKNAAATSATNAATSEANAADSASAAAASAAGVNLPPITAADAGKMLLVKGDASGYIAGTSIAMVADRTALKALSSDWDGAFIYGEGDRNGFFVRNAVDLSDEVTLDTEEGIYVAPNSGPTGASGAWVRHYSGFINIRWFGALGNLSHDDQPAVQGAVDVAAGRTIYAPVGQYRMNSGVSSTIPIHLTGDAIGAGPGPAAQSNVNVTQFICGFSAGDLFSVTSHYPSIFENFQINTLLAVRPKTSGSGINLIGDGTATVANYKIRNVDFVEQYTPITVSRPAWGEITGCNFVNWKQDAIKLWTDIEGIEGSGGHVHGNYFFGQTSGATQRSCIFLGCGYVNIYDNEILGALAGVYVQVQNKDAGYIRIFQNTIEEQNQYGVRVESLNNTQTTMMEINDNEFSCIANSATYNAAIYTAQNGSPAVNFIQDLHICRNTIRNNTAANKRHIFINNGRNVKIADNLMEELGANSPNGIQATSVSDSSGMLAPFVISNNQFLGTFGIKYNLSSDFNQMLFDQVGMTFAEMTAVNVRCADGSVVYCTNGTPTNLVAGGGTGCIAKRLNGVWRGD